MGSTYLELTNNVLKQLNEVQLDAMNFDDVLGLHAAAKDSVNFALQKINSQKFEWPFNAAEGTQVLVVGQEEYEFPVDYKVADFNSFYIEKDDSLDVNTRHLMHITRDEWYSNFREHDYDSGTDGLEIPKFIFKSTSQGFGVTPSPDEAYTVNYEYFVKPVKLVLYDDTVSVPSEFDYVILSACMWYMYLWRENEERTQIAKDEYKENIRDMTIILIGDNYESVRSTMLVRSRRDFYSTYPGMIF